MITINVIKHYQQRYPTVGDWYQNLDGDWIINVSKMGNWKFEFLVALHELVEMALCLSKGISEEVVTIFDREFEETRSSNDESEPGDHPLAPYYMEHQIATMVERLAARLLGVDWNEYNEVVNAL